MTPPTNNTARPLSPRFLWWAIAAAVIGLLALGAVFGWRWLQNHIEHREALQLVETYRDLDWN